MNPDPARALQTALLGDPVLFSVAATIVIFLLVAIALFVLLRRRPKPAQPAPPDLSIDVTSLDASGPPADAVRLEFYGVPVRLAVAVFAPVGRSGSLPSREQLPDMLEHLIPSFLQVVSSHGPVLRFWPFQLSSQGFTTSFFNKVALPGDRGKGTPWSSVAGKFTAVGQQYLVGLLFCSAQANGLSQVVIEHEGQWNDVLRVRS